MFIPGFPLDSYFDLSFSYDPLKHLSPNEKVTRNLEPLGAHLAATVRGSNRRRSVAPDPSERWAAFLARLPSSDGRSWHSSEDISLTLQTGPTHDAARVCRREAPSCGWDPNASAPV